MRIVCLITVGAFLLTIAVAAGKDERIGETAAAVAARVPRALILQPISKVREQEDGAFDWLADMFSGIVSSRKTPQYHRPPMLGPIRIPGMDDEVYIKQLGSLANAKNRVVVRVMTPQRAQMAEQMGISPTSYYTYQPVFPVAPTRQVLMQSAGFVPIPSPTPAAPWPQPRTMRQHYPMNYNKHMYPNSYNFPPPNMYHHYHPYRPTHQSYYEPYNPRHTQNQYGTYDFDNSIPHSSRASRYGPDPSRTTNYPLYPPLNERPELHHHDHVPEVHHHNNHETKNQTVSNEEVYNLKDSEVRSAGADESKGTLPESTEIYRPDRMVPTNPTWRNRFWTRTIRTTTNSPTTEKGENAKREKSSRDSPEFSTTEIKEIVAPDLKDWKEKNEKNDKEETRRTSDSRMDEEEIDMKDKTMLGKGESQEYIEKRHTNVRLTEVATEKSKIHERISSRKRNNWKPMEPKSTQPYTVWSSSKKNEIFSAITSTEAVTAGPRSTTTKVPSQTRDNPWKQQEMKRPLKTYQRKIGKSNRRVRIVESVSSSVSVTSSKGKGLKSKSS